MGGGVLLVVLAVLWAVVLIPMLLSRHDTTDETKQVDRFRRAMRSLAKSDDDFDPLRLRRNVAVRQAAIRRRRVSIAVLLFIVACGAAVAMGYLSTIWLIIPTLVALAWVYISGRAAARIKAQTTALVDDRPVAETPRARYVTPTPSWALRANQEVYDTDAIEQDDYLEATGTEGTWAPVPIQEPRHVRASGVSGDVIARASSWSRAVLNDVRTRAANAPDHTVRQQPRVDTAPPPMPAAQPPMPVPGYLEEEPPTDEIPIIRHVAG